MDKQLHEHGQVLALTYTSAWLCFAVLMLFWSVIGRMTLKTKTTSKIRPCDSEAIGLNFPRKILKVCMKN